MTEFEFNRHKVDWSKHQLVNRIVGTGKHSVSRWSLTVNGNHMYSVHFTNLFGQCLITGDYGNFICSREFDPAEDDYIDVVYMSEKMRLGGKHTTHSYDVECTKSTIIEAIYNLMYEHGVIECEIEEFDYTNITDRHTSKLPEHGKALYDYYVNCIIHASNDELEYLTYAQTELPPSLSVDDIMVSRTIDYSIRVVHNAFVEMCKRIKVNNYETIQE